MNVKGRFALQLTVAASRIRHIIVITDNANLLDVSKSCKAGRFLGFFMV